MHAQPGRNETDALIALPIKVDSRVRDVFSLNDLVAVDGADLPV